jgi:hypothetical protein
MASRGISVTGLPERYNEENPNLSLPSSQSSPVTGLLSTENELTEEQRNVLNAIKNDIIEDAGECGIEEVALDIAFREKGHPFFCFMGKMFVDVVMKHNPSVSEIRSAVCSNPDILQRIPHLTARMEQAFIHSKFGCSSGSEITTN